MIATRLAGKALGDFLGKVTPMVGSAVEQAVLNKLVGTYSPKEVTKTGPAMYRYPAQEGDVLIKPTYATPPGIPEYGMYRENYTETVIPEAANTRIGKIVTKLGPENIAKAAGVVVPAATAGGITLAGANLINKLPSNQPFTNQQYVPGSLPMTNYQAGESFLSQQRFQQELALMRAQQYSDQLKYQNQLGILQARQNASSPQGFGYGTGIDLSEDVISAPAQTYQ